LDFYEISKEELKDILISKPTGLKQRKKLKINENKALQIVENELKKFKRDNNTQWNNNKTSVLMGSHEEIDLTLSSIYNNYSFCHQHNIDLYNIEKLADIIKKATLLTEAHHIKFESTHKYYFINDVGSLITAKYNPHILTYKIEIYAKNLSELSMLSNIIVDEVNKANEEIQETTLGVYYVFYDKNNGRIMLTEEVLDIEYFDNLDSDYFNQYIDDELLFTQFLNAKEKILAIFGEPGVGKSKLSSAFLKYLLRHADDLNVKIKNNTKLIPVVIAKDEELFSVSQFWDELLNIDPMVVIADDVDNILNKRERSVNSNLEDQQNQAMTHLLSFTDGIINNDIKFVITTNSPSMEFDKAILRSGRMFSCFSLKPLSWEKALEIWVNNGLSKKEFPFKDNKYVLQADLGSKIESYKNNEGEQPESFFKDGTTDYIQIESKRLGF